LLLGTGLVAGGASAFNQVIERDLDALMSRTRSRPLPDQRLQPTEGVLFGSIVTLLGVLMIVASANLLAAAVALATLLSYVAVYTPLKRRTSFGTVIGAIGALPPMIGWAAAGGAAAAVMDALRHHVPVAAAALAIAWMCRDDYARAEFPMLAMLSRTGGAR
jgi:protoheme IX farnesyltransferase